MPNRPWAKVGVDRFTFNERNYLTIVDYFSGFWEIDPLNSMERGFLGHFFSHSFFFRTLFFKITFFKNFLGHFFLAHFLLSQQKNDDVINHVIFIFVHVIKGQGQTTFSKIPNTF